MLNRQLAILVHSNGAIMNDPIKIFFSYAHEDEELMNDVRRQLIVEERNG